MIKTTVSVSRVSTLPVIENINSSIEKTGKKLKILHLEDVSSDAVLINNQLKKSKLDYKMLVVDTKAKFIKELKDFTPDIILSDHTLPSFNSHEALIILYKTIPKIPFIVVTATMSDEFAADMIIRGADDYIIKDRLNRLPTAIQNALEKHRLQHEKEVIVDELIKSEARLKQTQAVANLGSWELDYSTGVAIWSDEQLSIYGLSLENNKQTYTTWTSYIHPDDLDYVLQKTNKTKATVNNAAFFHRIIRRDGTVRHLYSQTRVKFNKEGLPIGLYGVTQDITERTEAEESLKKSEANLQAIFENTSDGFILTNINGIIKSFNTKARDSIRLNTEQEIIVGRSIYDFLPDSRKKMYKDNISNVLSGKILQYDYPYTRKSGETKWFSFTINPVYNAETIEGISITSTDITERKKAEKKLTESELFNKSILASLSSHIAVIDNKGNIIAVNKAWDDFGKTNGADSSLEGGSTGSNYIGVCQRSMASGDIIAGQTLQGIQSVFNKEIKNFELEYPCHSLSEQRWFNLSVMNFGEDNSKVVISHQNITQRKIAEQKLQKSESRLKEAQVVANIGSWETDLQTLGVIWSEETHHIFETDPQKFQVTHETFLAFTHPDDCNKVNAAFENSLNSQAVNSVEHRIIATNGEVKHVIENWKIFRDEKGRPVRAAGTCQDITERKKVEEKLFQTEKYNRNLFEQTVLGLALARMDGTLADVNEAYAKIIGRSIEETLKLTYLEITPEKYLDQESKILEELMVTGKFINYEKEYIHKNGHLVPVKLSGNIFEKDGEKFIWSSVEDITERKKAEEENRFKANLLNTIGQAVIGTDMNGVVNYWNRAAENIYGWTKDEALGQYIVDLTPSEATNEQAIQIMEELKNGQTWSGEFKVRKEDGTTFPAMVTNSPIYDEHNKLSGIIGISSDITEMKKLEALLEKTNRLAAVGSWEIDVLKGNVFWSDITKEIYEVAKVYLPHSDVGLSYFKDGIHKEIISQKIQECIENGTPWDEELQITTFKGNHKWVRTIGEGEFLNGKCLRIHGSFQDIDSRKKAEIEVLKVYEEKNAILESIGDAFFAVDKNSIVTYWNNKAEIVTTKSRDEVIGKNIWEVFNGLLDTITYKNYHAAIKENKEQHYETFSEKLGKWLEVSAYPSNNGLTGYFKDITERKLAENERIKITADLVQRNKDLEQFSYIISHNLRAPVANIIGLSSMLQKDDLADNLKNKINIGLSTSVNKLDYVIRDLNSILTVRQQVNENKQLVVFSDLTHDIKLSINSIIIDKKATIVGDFSEVNELLTIKSYLYSIFYNLISNSLKYQQPGIAPVIEIKSQQLNDSIILFFKDNGLGINLRKRGDQVFGLYKRFHTQQAEGKGVGLYMVKTQVEAIGGNISLSSEVNKGTEFKIEFKC